MTEKPPQDPPESTTAEETERDESPDQPDAGEVRDADADEDMDADADEVEQELLDAMKKLRRTNKKVEEYLDGLAREVEKPASQEPALGPAQEQAQEQAKEEAQEQPEPRQDST